MVSIKFFVIFALAFACVFAVEEAVRAKKQVLLGGAYPYAYSAGYAASPIAYSAGYSGFPYGVASSFYY